MDGAYLSMADPAEMWAYWLLLLATMWPVIAMLLRLGRPHRKRRALS